MATTKTYAQRVEAVEAEGATTSDAQAAVDAEDMIAAQRLAKKEARTLPNKVRQFREKAGLSPKELAAKIGGNWTASTVRRIERGARKASVQQIAELVQALGQYADALGFSKEMTEGGPQEELPKEPAKPKAARRPVVGKRPAKAIDRTAAFADEG